MPQSCLWKCDVCNALLPTESDLYTHLCYHDNGPLVDPSDALTVLPPDQLDLAVTWYAVKAQVYRQVLDLQRFCPEIQLQAAEPPPEYEAPDDSEVPQIQNEAACSEDTDTASECHSENEAPMDYCDVNQVTPTSSDDVTETLLHVKEEPLTYDVELNYKTLTPEDLTKTDDDQAAEGRKHIETLVFKPLAYMDLQCERCRGRLRSFTGIRRHVRTCYPPPATPRIRCVPCSRRGVSLTSQAEVVQHVYDTHYQRYRCRHCGHGSSDADTVRAHVRDAHGYTVTVLEEKVDPPVRDYFSSRGMYQCAECDRAFASRIDRQRHLLSAHTVFRCQMCDDSFSCHVALLAHVRAEHPSGTRYRVIGKGVSVHQNGSDAVVRKRSLVIEEPAPAKVVLKDSDDGGQLKVVRCRRGENAAPMNVVKIVPDKSVDSSADVREDMRRNVITEREIDPVVTRDEDIVWLAPFGD